MSAEERAEHQAKLSARSAEARAEVVETRRDMEASARLGLNALLGQRLEAEADAFVQRLRDLALHPDPAVALQGMKLWIERVHGRAVQPTADVTEERNPLVEAFAALSPEERRAMLALARPLPTQPNPASEQAL